ncbi:four-helix bundle copper-binding protein [Mucilaginibacter limnophilus]|nr:four-helix bundle copper-binding protein [Mucilaginibacter limnophilus]
MSLGSPQAKEVCAICAEICEACGNECGKHQTEHCQECARICKSCAEECRKMAA